MSLRLELVGRATPCAPIDSDTVRLLLNGHDITPGAEITAQGVRYIPLDDCRQGRNDLRLSFRDTSGLLTTRAWSFFAP